MDSKLINDYPIEMYPFYQIKELFEEKSLLSFNDDEVEYIWNILLQGL